MHRDPRLRLPRQAVWRVSHGMYVESVEAVSDGVGWGGIIRAHRVVPDQSKGLFPLGFLRLACWRLLFTGCRVRPCVDLPTTPSTPSTTLNVLTILSILILRCGEITRLLTLLSEMLPLLGATSIFICPRVATFALLRGGDGG